MEAKDMETMDYMVELRAAYEQMSHIMDELRDLRDEMADFKFGALADFEHAVATYSNGMDGLLSMADKVIDSNLEHCKP